MPPNLYAHVRESLRPARTHTREAITHTARTGPSRGLSDGSLTYAEYKIRELQKSGFHDPALMMVVKDKPGGFVLTVFPWLLKVVAKSFSKDETRCTRALGPLAQLRLELEYLLLGRPSKACSGTSNAVSSMLK